MKLIVNRGFDKAFTRIAVLRNGRHVLSLPASQSHCELETEQGDRITVRLAFPAGLSMTIAEMECRAPGDIFHVSPAPALLRWMLACYMILPALFLAALILQKAIASCALSWLWAALAAVWALSLIAMSCCQHIPSASRRLFRATRI